MGETSYPDGIKLEVVHEPIRSSIHLGLGAGEVSCCPELRQARLSTQCSGGLLSDHGAGGSG